MRIGSWRDPEVARDAKVIAGLGGLVLFSLALPEGLAPILVILAALAAGVAAFMHLRGGPEESPSGGAEMPHRGPNASRIALAGFPGLVFTVGFVWMFWSGLPPLRPVVIALSVLGLLGGAVLVWIRRAQRVSSSTLLGLHGDDDSGLPHPVREQEPRGRRTKS